VHFSRIFVYRTFSCCEISAKIFDFVIDRNVKSTKRPDNYLEIVCASFHMEFHLFLPTTCVIAISFGPPKIVFQCTKVFILKYL
jgi:hypothetical protein